MYLNLAGAQEAGGLPRHALSSTAQTTVLSALFHSHNFSLTLPLELELDSLQCISTLQ